MLSFLLPFIAILIITTDAQKLFNTTEHHMQHQIDAAIKFMCGNQFESNGQFLYEAQLKQATIEMDVESNNVPRQGGGFYAIAMYYRLNHDQHNDAEQGFSITDCIHNTMRYLQTESVPIKQLQTNTQSGELMHGNTGATALSILGMIEICIVDDQALLCRQYAQQFIAWINGLLSTRKHNKVLKKGAFAKKLSATDRYTKSSVDYDSESYLALSRLLRYKSQLTPMIAAECEIWSDVLDVVGGLDEYYIQYTSEDDAHWLLQAWYARWVTFNENMQYFEHFGNHFMWQLMQKKLETEMDIDYSGGRCYLVEAMLDLMHSVQTIMAHSSYDNNDKAVFNATVWSVVAKRYKSMTMQQVFASEVDFYFEARFDGGFLSDNYNVDGEMLSERMRIDDTQHCVCALMKMKALLFMGVREFESYGYMNYNDPVIEESVVMKNGFANATNYDIMISAICLVVVIVLVNIIFFYWCYFYPKEQKQRNDLFWLGQTGLESQTSDAANAESDAA